MSYLICIMYIYILQKTCYIVLLPWLYYLGVCGTMYHYLLFASIVPSSECRQMFTATMVTKTSFASTFVHRLLLQLARRPRFCPAVHGCPWLSMNMKALSHEFSSGTIQRPWRSAGPWQTVHLSIPKFGKTGLHIKPGARQALRLRNTWGCPRLKATGLAEEKALAVSITKAQGAHQIALWKTRTARQDFAFAVLVSLPFGEKW